MPRTRTRPDDHVAAPRLRRQRRHHEEDDRSARTRTNRSHTRCYSTSPHLCSATSASPPPRRRPILLLPPSPPPQSPLCLLFTSYLLLLRIRPETTVTAVAVTYEPSRKTLVTLPRTTPFEDDYSTYRRCYAPRPVTLSRSFLRCCHTRLRVGSPVRS